MFWKRKPKAVAQPLMGDVASSAASQISLDTFEDWVSGQDHQVIHDLLVRSALRLLPGIFAENVSVLDPVKFDRALGGCYPIILRGWYSKYETPSQRGVMSAGELYDTYSGAADGGVSYTAFHCVESIADARMPEFNTFNKRYLCEVNNNLKNAVPDDHPAFFAALAQDGMALTGHATTPRDREELMKLSLWNDIKPAQYFTAGIAQFSQHAASSSEGEQLHRLIYEH